MTPQQIETRLVDLAARDARKPGVKLRGYFSCAVLFCFAVILVISVVLQPSENSAAAHVAQAVFAVGAVCLIGAFVSEFVAMWSQGKREQRGQID